MIATLPVRMLTIAHPGDQLESRAISVDLEAPDSEQILVPQGEDLFTAIHARLEALEVLGGAFELVSGELASLTIMTGGLGQNGLPMGFCGPHSIAVPASVVAGAGGSGWDEDGQRFSHCHAAFRDKSGALVGGHLLPEQAIADEGGVVINLYTLQTAYFRRRLDPETLFTIFHPEAA